MDYVPVYAEQAGGAIDIDASAGGSWACRPWR